MNLWLFVFLISIFNSAHASISVLKSQINQQQYSKAIKLGEALKQQNPNSVSVFFYTALAYQNNKQLERAKADYLKAIQLNPHLPEAYNNLASIYVAEKNYTKAAKILTSAINSQPSIATAYANLSQIYRHLASQAYQQVLSEEERSKQTKNNIKTQLLTTLDINETLIPIKIPVEKPKIVVAAAPIIKAMVAPKVSKKPVIKTHDSKTVLLSPKQTVINWAKAWKAKQYQAYINSYSKNYAPKNLSHKQWLAQREKRIKRPGKIQVSVNNFDIKLSPNKAYVNFDQTYRSASYHDKVRKRMHLVRVNNQWRISSEVTLAVLK